MKITAITATFGRPEAMTLCEKWMARQTRQPDQWLILDDDSPMATKILRALESGLVEGDAIVFWEDDDFFFPTWIEWCAKQLEKFDLVGQGNALYYHVGKRWWSECVNVRHASLCNSAIGADMFQPLINVLRSFDSPFFDTRLWLVDRAKYLQIPRAEKDRLVIGIKGMPGTRGYSPEHWATNPPGVHSDPSLTKLWKLIGKDAKEYAQFKR